MSRLERVSHYGVLLVALSAVFVSVWQVRILQEHNKLSVKPIMDFRIFSDSTHLMHLKISNRGVGPAIFREVRYSYKGESYVEWPSVLSAAGIMDQAKGMMSYQAQTVMSPDTEWVILSLQKTDAKKAGISVEIVYESIYEDQFELVIEF